MSVVTIRMLARELNLSVATVSKALRDSYEINAQTKQRVLEMARTMAYIPNPYASSLRRKTSRTIAVVLPDMADSFFSLAVNGIHAVAAEKGYHVLFYLTFEVYEREIAILHDCQSGRVDGVLLSVSENTVEGGHIRSLVSAGVPIVFFDRICEDVEASKVVTDDFGSSYEATRTLIGQGCRRIACICTSAGLSISNKREEGFRAALAESGLAADKNSVIVCSGTAEENDKKIQQLLKNKKRPDGILATAEKLVTPLYLASQLLGLAIPEDLKLISFTNLPSAVILSPSLTTVKQPAFEIGKQAAQLLFARIEKPSLNMLIEKIVLPSVIETRKSTGHV